MDWNKDFEGESCAGNNALNQQAQEWRAQVCYYYFHYSFGSVSPFPLHFLNQGILLNSLDFCLFPKLRRKHNVRKVGTIFAIPKSFLIYWSIYQHYLHPSLSSCIFQSCRAEEGNLNPVFFLLGSPNGLILRELSSPLWQISKILEYE